MGKLFLGNIFSHAFENFSIFFNLSPTIIEFVAISYMNPVLDKYPWLQKFLYIEMGTNGIEHVLPAIENMLALRECYANHIYLCMIAIYHKNRW